MHNDPSEVVVNILAGVLTTLCQTNDVCLNYFFLFFTRYYSEILCNYILCNIETVELIYP